MTDGRRERWRARWGRARAVTAAAVLAMVALAARAGAADGPPAAATRPATRPTTLRVLTYNLHHGTTAADVPSLDRQAKVIRDADPDLVALQELDRNTTRTGKVDQLARLAELTGLHPTFGKAMDYAGGEYGNGVLSKLPAESATTHALPSTPGEEPRCAVVTTVRLADGQTVTLAATHLNHRKAAERTAQTTELATLLGPTPGQMTRDGRHIGPILPGPTILAGDFNAAPDSAAVEVLRRAGYRHAFAADPVADGARPAPTDPADRPRVAIDYVWVGPAAARWRVVEARVLDEPDASDHRPVLVVLELTGR